MRFTVLIMRFRVLLSGYMQNLVRAHFNWDQYLFYSKFDWIYMFYSTLYLFYSKKRSCKHNYSYDR
jgi:hypothetical protein